MRKTKLDSYIQYRVTAISNITGEKYETNYASQYGGYNMYIRLENGGERRGVFGFDLRKSQKEMAEYVDGIYTALCWAGANMNK